jgi:hypothetical protein
MANRAFVAAGARVAKSLVIDVPITVKALFYSFCNGIDGTSSCEDDPDARLALGRAAPAAYFAAKPASASSNSQFMFYPQALAKQLKPDAALTYAEQDIIAEFNSDFEYYFSSVSFCNISS